ncbi:MAG: threonine/serine exporter [Oscillibacter sp.]|nr:threonine/serine exporter [Oscillibacter sp.]
METVCLHYALPCLCAFLSCVGFTLTFNIHGVGKLIAGVGGALGWLVYLLGDKTIFAAFLAAAAIGVFAEVMSRVRRCPVTGYVLVALLPLVPGGGVYYAMRHCVAGETELFLNTLLHTFGMAAALAVGAMLASSVFRAMFPRLRPLGKNNGG